MRRGGKMMRRGKVMVSRKTKTMRRGGQRGGGVGGGGDSVGGWIGWRGRGRRADRSREAETGAGGRGDPSVERKKGLG
jgi:hypothetical protein